MQSGSFILHIGTVGGAGCVDDEATIIGCSRAARAVAAILFIIGAAAGRERM